MKNGKALKVVVKNVGETPKVLVIEQDLKSMQAIVGGRMELARLSDIPPLVAIVNEEGLLLNLPPNGCGFVGNYFITKAGKNRDFASLSDEEVQKAIDYLESTNEAMPPQEPFFTVVALTAEEMLKRIDRPKSGRKKEKMKTMTKKRSALKQRIITAMKERVKTPTILGERIEPNEGTIGCKLFDIWNANANQKQTVGQIRNYLEEELSSIGEALGYLGDFADDMKLSDKA